MEIFYRWLRVGGSMFWLDRSKWTFLLQGWKLMEAGYGWMDIFMVGGNWWRYILCG